MNESLWQGELVKLTAVNPETDPEQFARWWADSEHLRLLDSLLARPKRASQFTTDLAKWVNGDDNSLFAIRTVREAQLLGFIELEGFKWAQGTGWLAVTIGDRKYWGSGYGSEAVRLILRYGFTELNLQRIALTVFEYNPRAIRAYERCGFVVEGRAREFLNRAGRRWDLIYMGVLRDEWLRSHL